MLRYLKERRGVTLVELVVTVAILAILATIVTPLTQMTARRTREIELRRNLRTIRTAIDDYKKKYEWALDNKKINTVVNKSSGCPETLQVLVDGYDFGEVTPAKRKFLRRIPPDPMNPPKPGEEPKWGMRSYEDKSDSSSWGGEDVYDVYSLSEGTAIDGTKYKDW
jgi:general secretion pathway protein G